MNAKIKKNKKKKPRLTGPISTATAYKGRINNVFGFVIELNVALATGTILFLGLIRLRIGIQTDDFFVY